MAPRISETPETEQHYLAQFAIVAGLTRAMSPLWTRLDPTNLAATFEPLVRGVSALAQQYSRASISTAADYYEAVRAERVAGAYNALTIDPPSMDAITARVDRNAAPLLRAAETVPDEVYLAELTAALIREAEAAAAEVTADGGSNEVFAALSRDREAVGWARVTRPSACSFCRMLAVRGPVYATKGTANFRAHVPINGRGGVCRCTVEPLFGEHYEAPAHVRADAALWDRVVESSMTPAEARNEFRRHVEGRADGPRRELKSQRAERRRRESRPKVKGQQLGFDNLTPSQLRHHLQVTEGLPESEYRTKQLDRLRTRLAELGDD